MKILLDESVPQKLRLLISAQHAVVTTAYMGWSGLKNGALLTQAEAAGFDLFVTADQELRYQQNLTERSLAVLTLGTNNWAVIKGAAERINVAIDCTKPGLITFLDLAAEPE